MQILSCSNEKSLEKTHAHAVPLRRAESAVCASSAKLDRRRPSKLNSAPTTTHQTIPHRWIYLLLPAAQTHNKPRPRMCQSYDTHYTRSLRVCCIDCVLHAESSSICEQNEQPSGRPTNVSEWSSPPSTELLSCNQTQPGGKIATARQDRKGKWHRNPKPEEQQQQQPTSVQQSSVRAKRRFFVCCSCGRNAKHARSHQRVPSSPVSVVLPTNRGFFCASWCWWVSSDDEWKQRLWEGLQGARRSMLSWDNVAKFVAARAD